MMSEMAKFMAGFTKRQLLGINMEQSNYSREVEKTDDYEIHHADCIDLASEIDDNSIDYTVYSPPFESLYTYSNSDRDMGNSKDANEFWNHYKFLITEHFRITKPGILLVHGVGTNDAEYVTQKTVNGKRVICPFYAAWVNMLGRCYSVDYQKKQKTYKGCSVDKVWHLFSSFKSWMKKQEWEGNELDKDILFPGNKIYSAKFCVFVPTNINTLFGGDKKRRGKYLQGVSWHKGAKKFRSSCRCDGKCVHIGLFNNEIEAHNKYKEFKMNYILRLASAQKDKRLKNALMMKSTEYT